MGCELDMMTYVCGSYVDLCGATFEDQYQVRHVRPLEQETAQAPCF